MSTKQTDSCLKIICFPNQVKKHVSSRYPKGDKKQKNKKQTRTSNRYCSSFFVYSRQFTVLSKGKSSLVCLLFFDDLFDLLKNSKIYIYIYIYIYVCVCVCEYLMVNVSVYTIVELFLSCLRSFFFLFFLSHRFIHQEYNIIRTIR